VTTATVPASTTTKKSAAKAKRRGGAGWLIETIIVLLCLGWTIPTISLVITSFRPAELAQSSGWWTWFVNPLQVTLDNYQGVLNNESNPMGPAFINSIAIAVPSTIIPILLAAFAAYAFTFMEFPARDILFIVVVGLLVVPNQVALLPLSVLFQQWGMQGQFVTVWLAHAGFGMPLAVYILRNYMATLPKAVTESAKIDGATHFQIFWRLIIPMSWPALASFAIFQFLWVWNDLLVALFFIGPGENQPLTIALYSLLGSRGLGWQLLTAGACLTMVIPLIVFLSLQRFFIRGLTAGAVKG
jgi:alpha-glucoside transport system permease protein